MSPIILQTAGFISAFTFFYISLHISGLLNLEVLRQNIDGIAPLYGAVALIFSIISAFIIQTEWARWDNLVDAVKDELSSLRELHFLSKQFPKDISEHIHESVKEYVQALIDEDWHMVDRGEDSNKVELSMQHLQQHVYDISAQNRHASIAYDVLAKTMQARNNRLRHGLSHVPSLLRFTISTATFLLIVLSFFVAVANPILDYVFTLSIGLLAFLIAMVIEDLDHPYRPGNWHLNKNIYKKLLAEMN